MSKMLVIHECGMCCYFDNEYYDYNSECIKLNRKVNGDSIPVDCPLPEASEAIK